ncbi:MAG: YgaP-like transmembrane domain, partial [Rhodocyclaceae bacterium]
SFKDAVSPFHKTAYSPIFRKSEFCAMCHMERADDLEGIGVPSMMTLDEYPAWKTLFDAGKTDKQCQDCHMYAGGKDAWRSHKLANVGVERNPAMLFGHHWRGSYFDGEMAKRASNLTLAAQRKGEELVVSATVENVGAAHKFPGGPPFRQVLLLIDAKDETGKALEPLDPPRMNPMEARHANRIFDVGGGYRENGFFAWWEFLNRKPFPEMPYLGQIGKVYNGSWVSPPFLPMDWMLRWLWIGVLPLVIGLLGWSPWRAMMSGGTGGGKRKGFFSKNVGTLDRLIRILGGALVMFFVPMPWHLIGMIPLASGLLGWCPTYFLIGRLDTCEKSGFFSRNVGGIDRLLRIVGGLILLGMCFFGPRTPWGLIGLVPLVSGLLGWCPTYRLIGNLDTRPAKPVQLFAPNLGASDRWLRALGGLFLLSLVFWGPQTPWGSLGIVPLFTAIVGSCIPYRLAGIDTRSPAERERLYWRAAWSNLDDRERRFRLAAGTMMLFVAIVVPKA